MNCLIIPVGVNSNYVQSFDNSCMNIILMNKCNKILIKGVLSM